MRERLDRGERIAESGQVEGRREGAAREGGLDALRMGHERALDRARQPSDLPDQYVEARRRLDDGAGSPSRQAEELPQREVDPQAYYFVEAKAWLRARNDPASRGAEGFTTRLPADDHLGRGVRGESDGGLRGRGATLEVHWGARGPGEDWRADRVVLDVGGSREELRPAGRAERLDAERGPHARRRGQLDVRGSTPPLRETVWAEHPDEYDTPNEVQERRAGHRSAPFEHPERWVKEVNPGGPDGPFDATGEPWRTVNCADCSRAVERNWRGEVEVAAGLKVGHGEGTDRTERWAGAEFRPASFDQVRESLARGGHGSSAVIGVDWKLGGGHYFNAVNHEGRILAVDGQTGVVDGWPPGEDVFGYEEQDVLFCEVIVRDRDGEEIEL